VGKFGKKAEKGMKNAPKDAFALGGVADFPVWNPLEKSEKKCQNHLIFFFFFFLFLIQAPFF
jgi:hypothetical protein